MTKKVTLADVAERASVAIGTASEALNNKPGVSEGTRIRIREAARQLGYDVRLRLDAPAESRLGVMGIVRHEQHDYPGIDPFYSPVVAGVDRQCQENHYQLLYNTAQVDGYNRVQRLPVTLLSAEVDAIIVVGMYLPRARAKELQAMGCPVVLVDGYADGARFDRVLTNNVDGACDIVNHLIQKGHRHIGLIGSSDDTYPSIRERREGYLKALARAGIQDVYIENGMLNREAAYHATRALVQRQPHLTAIFAVNDNAAYGSISALRGMGYAVPEQVSVVGFDDLFYAIEMNPPLTTMSIDKVRMGEVAVKQLQYRLQHRDAPVMTQMLDARMILRQSVKALV